MRVRVFMNACSKKHSVPEEIEILKKNAQTAGIHQKIN